MNKQKLVLVYNSPACWVDNDFKILSEKYEVTRVYINGKADYTFKMLKLIISADITYFWFASLIFLPVIMLATILRKQRVIVAGGYDVAFCPEENYGAFTFGKFNKILRKFFFFLGQKVFTVSDFSTNEAVNNAKVSLSKINRIYNCVSRVKIRECKRFKKILMVSNIDENRFRIKGFDRFLTVVNLFPEYEFTHVGEINAEVLSKLKIPSNLKLLGKKGSEELISIYSSHRFAVQFSRYESFCLTIVEASSLGCYPIVSSDGALPEVIQGIGEVVNFNKNINVRSKLLKIFELEPSADIVSKKTVAKYGVDVRRRHVFESLEVF